MIELEKNPAIKTKEENIDIEETKRVLLNMLDNKKDIKNIEDQENAKAIDENTKKWNTNDKVLELFAVKINKDTELKGKYAIILISILIIQLIVLNILFVLPWQAVFFLFYTQAAVVQILPCTLHQICHTKYYIIQP